jgi:hypothetical protein
MTEQLEIKGSQKRFWGILLPAYLVCSAILLRFSQWGLAVFAPKVDMPLRIFAGYMPIVLLVILLILMFALYRKYLGLSFLFTATHLVLKHHGRRVELPWDDIQVYEEKSVAVIRDSSQQVVIHRFFFDELPRLCELVREAHRYKRKDWGTGPG